MSAITVKTNGHQRELKSLAELDEATVDEWFDYLHDAWYGQTDEALQPRFFQYRGSWYDTQEFAAIGVRSHRIGEPGRNGFGLLVDDDSPLLSWDGVQTESAFSAVLLKWGHDWSGQPDFEAVIVAYAHW